MHTRLDQNKPELGITVLPVPLQVLANGHSLLDQAVQVLRDLGGEPCQKEKAHRQKKIEKKSTNSRVLTQDNMIHVVELVNKTRIYLYPLNPLSRSPRYDVTTTDAAYYYVSLIG